MHGGRTDQGHGTGVVEALLEEHRGGVKVTGLVLDVAGIEGSLSQGNAIQLTGIDLGFEFHQGAVLFASIQISHARTEEFSLFCGRSLAVVAELHHTHHDNHHHHEGSNDLGAVCDKKFLNFRIVGIRFVSHF